MHDIEYKRPKGRRKYTSTKKHQKNAKSKHSKWIDVNTERNTFDVADYGNFELTPGSIAWFDDNQNLWGFLNNHPSVGLNKEQFGFFQNPNNPALEWHGFPIIPFSQPRYNIPERLFELWINLGYITQEDVPSIMNKRRI